MVDDDGVKWPMLFTIVYEDGDKEDVALEELQAGAGSNATVAGQPGLPLPARIGEWQRCLHPLQLAPASLLQEIMLGQPAAAQRQQEAAPRPPAVKQERAEDDENDENAAAAAPRPAKHRKTAGALGRVLGDATERAHNAHRAPGDERRSRWAAAGRQREMQHGLPQGAAACRAPRQAAPTLPAAAAVLPTRRRESKRRHDEDFQYEDPRAAKRAAAAAPAPGRFGIRAPTAAAAAAAANPASESQASAAVR